MVDTVNRDVGMSAPPSSSSFGSKPFQTVLETIVKLSLISASSKKGAADSGSSRSSTGVLETVEI